jgi:hypothetical protein
MKQEHEQNKCQLDFTHGCFGSTSAAPCKSNFCAQFIHKQQTGIADINPKNIGKIAKSLLRNFGNSVRLKKLNMLAKKKKK